MRQKVIRKAPEQAKKPTPNLTGIPTQMKLDFERRSGLSFDDVRVHYNSDKPARIGALAYTQGNQVHVGPGQERHLKHELGHVVQQKQGIVRPTTWINGLPVNDSPLLEKDATAGGCKSNIHLIAAFPQNYVQPIQKVDKNLLQSVRDKLGKNIEEKKVDYLLNIFLASCMKELPSREEEREKFISDFCEFILMRERAHNGSEWVVTFGDQEVATGARAYTETGKPVYATSYDLTDDDEYKRNMEVLAQGARNQHIQNVELTDSGAEGFNQLSPPFDSRKTKVAFDHPYTHGRYSAVFKDGSVEGLCRMLYHFVREQSFGRVQITIRAVDKSQRKLHKIYDLAPEGMFIYDIMRSHALTHRATMEKTDSGIKPMEQSLTIKFVNFSVYFRGLMKNAEDVIQIYNDLRKESLSLNQFAIDVFNSFVSCYNQRTKSAKWPIYLKELYPRKLSIIPACRIEEVEKDGEIIARLVRQKMDTQRKENSKFHGSLSAPKMCYLKHLTVLRAVQIAEKICSLPSIQDDTYANIADQSGEKLMEGHPYNSQQKEFSDASDDEK